MARSPVALSAANTATLSAVMSNGTVAARCVGSLESAGFRRRSEAGEVIQQLSLKRPELLLSFRHPVKDPSGGAGGLAKGQRSRRVHPPQGGGDRANEQLERLGPVSVARQNRSVCTMSWVAYGNQG